MTNSVVIGYGTSYELQRLITGTPGASNVSFSTMYNAHLDCGTSATPWLLSDDNIFFVDVGGAPANTVSGTACSHNYDIIKPQSTNPGGTGNQVGIDPKFVSASTGDLHLMSTSPAINAANPAVSNITYDYEGTPRPQGAANDIGAYEYH